MRTLILTCIPGFLLFFSCKNTAVDKQTNNKGISLPPGTITAIVSISELNCWVERGQFFVTGICDSKADEWQKFWLKMTPMDAEGRPLKVNGDTSSMFVTFSDAVPPYGRTSFFAGWPLEAFSGTPDSCIVTGAAALPVNPGPILVTSAQSGVRMLVPASPGDTVNVEKAWQVSVTIENPLDLPAYHPRIELLLYGTDKRLWFATVLNPDDPDQKSYLFSERQGAMEPKEKRNFGANITYDNLPQALQSKKIGRVEFQPFESR